MKLYLEPSIYRRPLSSGTVHFGSNDRPVWLKTVHVWKDLSLSRDCPLEGPSTFNLLDLPLWTRLNSRISKVWVFNRFLFQMYRSVTFILWQGVKEDMITVVQRPK